MAAYSELNEIFPWFLLLPKEKVMELVYILLAENREDVTNGSSFAVTTDAQEGYQHLWLSDVSYTYLQGVESKNDYPVMY